MAALYRVEDGTNVRVSNVGAAEELGPGGGIQYEVREPKLKMDSDKLDTDDYPGEFVDPRVVRDDLESELQDALE